MTRESLSTVEMKLRLQSALAASSSKRHSGPGAIENEVNKLARELSLVLLEFLDVGSESQRSASRIIVLVAFAAHKIFPIRMEP